LFRGFYAAGGGKRKNVLKSLFAGADIRMKKMPARDKEELVRIVKTGLTNGYPAYFYR
jgi:hypothetical protein